MDEIGLGNDTVAGLLALSSDDRAELKAFLPTLEAGIDRLLDRFYDTVKAIPDLARMFTSTAQLSHARDAQKAHWGRLFSGKFDSDYIGSVRKIGLTHHRIGLNPQVYMAGYARVLADILDLSQRSHKGDFARKKARLNRLHRQQSAITKTIFFDMQLSISVYLEEQGKAKVSALQFMADTVESDAGSAVAEIARNTSEMVDNAQQMAQSAVAVGVDCQSVAAAAMQALTNAQTVSAATEQLSASINEISGQIDTASRITTSAVGLAVSYRETIATLSQTVGRISEVTKMISSIASQTNRLALNATIEAARVGEAGKGFGVVAVEVKNLANQTTKATSDIASQVAEIQSTTVEAVKAADQIVDAISEISTVSSAVAAAIAEQSAATLEIARNVAHTTDATHEIATRIDHVSGEAAATGEHAHDVSRICGEVAVAIESFREAMVHTVRTSAPEVNRRTEVRLSVSRAVRVGIGADTVHDGTLIEISPKGVKVSGLPDIPVGQDCTIFLDGLKVSAQAKKIKKGLSRFRIQEGDQPAVKAWIGANGVVCLAGKAGDGKPPETSPRRATA